TLRAQARTEALPALLRDLVHVPATKRLRRAGSLAGDLEGLNEQDRRAAVLELVCSQVAAVLGHPTADAIKPERAFKDLGFDSLLGVELRNRLTQTTGLRLPATLIFDYPTPTELTSHIINELTGAKANVTPARSVAPVDEPVAIIGMSCRYPGGVHSPEELWDLVVGGQDVISAFPTDRSWDLEALHSPDPDRRGTSWALQGGFLSNAGDFDAEFFGIGPREALAMDPQQRLLLEVCWEAIEGAGIDPISLRGTQTGTFAGISASAYGGPVSSSSAVVEGYRLTGSVTSAASGRVAYAFGLEGPAVSVDTACSSSLVALHLACQALRQGECSMALAGGVMVMATPDLFVEFSRQGGLARDGRCKSFSADADGTGWSEGAGMLVVERLSDARRLGHPVVAVVRGSAVNQDGASNGLTAPNGLSQQRVIHKALANAGLQAHEVDAVEAHGTGTRLGDPIEAQALIATYGQHPERERPLLLGSIKSNIGHAATAAGVAGVIKMAMALEHEVLPATLHAQEPSTEIDWSAGAVELLRDATPWPANGHPRRAGVSSFGVSGTNVHLIVEEPPDHINAPKASSRPGGDLSDIQDEASKVTLTPWVVSAKDEWALCEQAERLRAHIDANPGLNTADVGFTLARRTTFEHRAVVFGEGRSELLEGLKRLTAGESGSSIVRGAAGGSEQKLAFMFTGQGAQRAGMGREAHETFPVFARVLDEVCAELDARLEYPLKEVFWAEAHSKTAGLLDQTVYTQAGLFAFEVATFHLVQHFGVQPDFLVGHSIGELAAAQVAGMLSMSDACALVVARGQLMQALPSGGAMVAIQASEQEMLVSLAGLEQSVALAGVNGPDSVVLSGEQRAVLDLADTWERQGRKTRRLRVSHAFHSPCIDGMLEEFRQAAAELSFAEPKIPIVSNLTGEAIAAELICTPDYWVRQARQTVRFADCVNWLLSRGVGLFLELGPDGVLSAMVEDCLISANGEGKQSPVGAAGDGQAVETGSRDELTPAAIPLLRRERGEAQSLLGGIARLWTRGKTVDWDVALEGSDRKRVGLPTYAFKRERFWLDSVWRGGDARAIGQASADHPLLTAAVALPGEGWLFTSRLSLREHPWLADHVVLGAVVLPGTAFLELALHAGAHIECGFVRELVLQTPLLLDERGSAQLQVRVGEADESDVRSLSVHSRVEDAPGNASASEAEWVCHAVGSLASSIHDGHTAQAGVTVGDDGMWPPSGAEPVPLENAYDRLADSGLDYGPVFQGLIGAWRRDDEMFVEVCLPSGERDRAGSFGLHPALLDAVLHVLALGGRAEEEHVQEGVPLPFSWSDVSLTVSGASALRARIAPAGGDVVSILVADEHGSPVASIGSLATRRALAADIGRSARSQHDSMLGVEWVDGPVLAPASTGASVLLVTRRAEVFDALQSAGVTCQMLADLDGLGDAMDGGGETPETVLLDVGGLGETAGPAGEGIAGGTPDVVRAVLARVLTFVQKWLVDERFAARRLVLVTRGAVAVDVEEDVADLSGGTVWGLVRSAQSENPGRFVLVDVDGGESSWRALDRVVGLEEPQLALRGGVVRVPRLSD
ncbi:MAG: beta-ketoacyl synthase N-terminal-like domain-containing protein, partial [Solirubrobacteraceae bacterium]